MKLKVSLARAVFIWTYLTRLFEFSVNTLQPLEADLVRTNNTCTKFY